MEYSPQRHSVFNGLGGTFGAVRQKGVGCIAIHTGHKRSERVYPEMMGLSIPKKCHLAIYPSGKGWKVQQWPQPDSVFFDLLQDSLKGGCEVASNLHYKLLQISCEGNQYCSFFIASSGI